MLAIVTGSSRGFGRTLLESCDKLGFETVGLCRKPVLKNEISCDLSNENSYKDVIERVSVFKTSATKFKNGTEFKRIVVIHNAGSVGPIDKKFEENTNLEKDLRTYLEVNLVSFASLTSQVYKHFPNSEITFVNISSLCAVAPFSTLGFYCSGKAARDMFFGCLAKESEDGERRVRFLNYAPGPLDTDMYKTIEDESASDSIKNMFGENRKGILSVGQSCDILMKLVFPEKFDSKWDGVYKWKSGDHVDYFDVVEDLAPEGFEN